MDQRLYQNVHGLGPVPGVMRIVPLVLVAAAAAGPVGKQLERHGSRPVIIAGMLAIAAGCGILAFLEQTTPYPLVLLALALIVNDRPHGATADRPSGSTERGHGWGVSFSVGRGHRGSAKRIHPSQGLVHHVEASC